MAATPSSVTSGKATLACGIATAIVAVLLVPYLFAAMFSVMMFDAPGSTQNPWIWIAFLAVVSYPLLLIVSVIAGWVLVAKGRFAAAFRIAVVGSVLAAAPAALFSLSVMSGL